MKKKVLLLAGLCAFSLCTWEAKAVNLERASIVNMEDNVPTGYEVIVLQGTLMYGVSPNVIVAGSNRNSVYLHFNQRFGNVNVRIYNDSGNLVYNSIVDTSVQQTVIISIIGNSNGTYAVELDNAFGEAEGYFEPNQH